MCYCFYPTLHQHFSGLAACCMWDGCNGNAIKATKVNNMDYIDYMKNLSASSTTYHKVNTFSASAQDQAKHKMGIDLLTASETPGVYADDFGWIQPKSQSNTIEKGTFSDKKLTWPVGGSNP